MHKSSYDKVVEFKKQFLTDKVSQKLTIYDIGSLDVNGSYRPIFSESAWNYKGVDMAKGPNVDILLANPYRWNKIPSGSADVIISGQAFEHMSNIWAAMLEVSRVLKPGGLCCIVVPSSGPEHRYPIDCWRFYPDGLISLAAFGGLELIKAYTQWEKLGYEDGSDAWHDSVLICRRPVLNLWKTIKRNVKQKIQHRALTIGIR